MILCPACGTHTGEEFHGGLAVCLACTHCWQADLTPTISYDKKYAENTYEKYDGRPSALMRAGFCCALLGKPSSQVPGRMLDFGCGNGSFVKTMVSLGFSCYGHDINNENDDFPRALPRTFAYDIVTFFDSLEHLPKFDVLDEIITKFIVISVPLRPSPFWPTEDTLHQWRHYKPGEHLHYFTERSLNALMSRNGYARLSVSNFEDALRGHVKVGGRTLPNILTASFVKKRP